MNSNKRSDAASQYRALYSSKRWRALRAQALTRDLFRCQRPGCGVQLTAGRSDKTSAVVHHVQPHKGDLELFFDLGNLEAVCWSCHSGEIQSEEKLGFDSTIGADGWPVDPRNPAAK